jgi:hypothetical protein
MKFERTRPWIVILLFVVVILGCASADYKSPEFDPSQHARIRVFHGTKVDIYFGDVCRGGASGVIHASEGGYSYLSRGRRVGMPRTEPMLSSFYHEYVIPARGLVTIRIYWRVQFPNNTWQSCGPIYTLFTPDPGQDYETYMKFDTGFFKSGVCQGVEVRKFVPDTDGKIKTVPAPLNAIPFNFC